MASQIGERIKISIFGESHSEAIGVVIDGLPAGLSIDEKKLSAFLSRRAPGSGEHTTQRKEADAPHFLSGVVEGVTCGSPICAIIENTNTRSGDYSSLRDVPQLRRGCRQTYQNNGASQKQFCYDYLSLFQQ